MATGPKLVICSVLAILGLGCATKKDAVWLEQPREVGSPRIALEGSLSTTLDGDERTGKPDATPRSVGKSGEVAAGSLGTRGFDRGVRLASWPEQTPAPMTRSASDSAGPASPDVMAGDSPVDPVLPPLPPLASPVAEGSVAGGGGGATAAGGDQSASTLANAVSGNPAASNIVAGSGRLGEFLGINRNGIRFGGLNITDANGILAGGLGPGKWAGDTLTIADLSIDLEKFAGWKGGLIGSEFLYYDGFGPGYSINHKVQGKNDPNALAGTAMGFNSLSAAPPFSRTELYELWFRQEFFDKKLIVRIGKSVPTYDFNNVVKTIQLGDQQSSIPAISSAIFTPLYVNPTMLGVIPGYYNSASGIVASLIPTDNFYVTYGFFDGNLARGEQTGFDGPRFNGYYLHLAEAGANWRVGEEKKPGRFGVGGWFQTGRFTGFDGQRIEGADGIYLFGSQRLYYEKPGVGNNGLISWIQFGATNSDIVFTHRYFGLGLTYFGPLPGRDDDSCGFGLAYGEMSGNANAGAIFFQDDNLRTNRLGPSETILTWYYQMKVREGIYMQPNVSYIPNPAQHPGIPGAFAFTMRAIILF